MSNATFQVWQMTRLRLMLWMIAYSRTGKKLTPEMLELQELIDQQQSVIFEALKGENK